MPDEESVNRALDELFNDWVDSMQEDDTMPDVRNCSRCGEILFAGHVHGEDGYRLHRPLETCQEWINREAVESGHYKFIYAVCSAAQDHERIDLPNGLIGIVAWTTEYDWSNWGENRPAGCWIAEYFNPEDSDITMYGFRTRLDAELFVLYSNYMELSESSTYGFPVYNDATDHYNNRSQELNRLFTIARDEIGTYTAPNSAEYQAPFDRWAHRVMSDAELLGIGADTLEES